MRIAGELTTAASSIWAVQGAMLVAGVVPVGGIAAVLILVGGRSLANPAALGNLWECLGAGVAILAAYGLILYQMLRVVPRRTIRSFELSDKTFTCTTQRDGQRSYPIEAIKTVRAVRSSKGRGVTSWLMHFTGSGWIELSRWTTHAEDLVAALNSRRTEPLSRDSELRENPPADGSSRRTS